MGTEGNNLRRPVSVLFVCLGNICRSPMAEGVFRHVTKHPNNPLISDIDSAGTGAYHAGEGPDTRTMSVLEANGITDYRHAARKLTTSDFRKFDYLFAMDGDNLDDMRQLRKRAAAEKPSEGTGLGKVMLFGDFGGRKGEEVIDPYYGARNGFEVAYEQMIRFTEGFLKHLTEESVTEEDS